VSSFEFLGHSDQIRDRPDLTRYDYSEPSFVVTPVIRINDISNSTHGVMLLIGNQVLEPAVSNNTFTATYKLSENGAVAPQYNGNNLGTRPRIAVAG